MAGGRGRNGPDLISSLPDHLLLMILVLLPTLDAIRTCVLSRRWTTLWTQLPELQFHDSDRQIDRLYEFSDLVNGALRRQRGILTRLDISVSYGFNINPQRFVEWIGIAAERTTEYFFFSMLSMRMHYNRTMYIDMPCFPRTKKLFLGFTKEAYLIIPRAHAGTFASLTALDLITCSFYDGGARLNDALSFRCPLLQLLRIEDISGLCELRFRSGSLQGLQLRFLTDLEQMDVVASALFRLTVSYCFVENMVLGHTTFSVDAPVLHDLTWHGTCPHEMRFSEPMDARPRLEKLAYDACKRGVVNQNDTKILENFRKVDTLQFHISTPYNVQGHLESIENIPFPPHLELELCVARNGHTLGACAIPLLRRSGSTRKITCNLINYDPRGGRHRCYPADCVCRDPERWWYDNNVNLDSLQELVFNNLMGTDDEHYFLCFIFRNALSLRTMSVRVLADRPSHFRRICDSILHYTPTQCRVTFTVANFRPELP